MVEILTIILSFIFFMLILDKAHLVVLRPVSFGIVIIISLFLGYLMANLLSYVLDIAIIVAIILAIAFFVKKK